MSVIVWFRRDLRLSDNPALVNAIASGKAVIPIYINDIREAQGWPNGGASKWWLHQSLLSLDRDLRKIGGRLYIFSGDPKEILNDLLAKIDVQGVFWNRRYEPESIELDSALKDDLKGRGIAVESFNGSLLCEPWEGRKADGTPYLVYTPFMKSLFKNMRERDCYDIPSRVNVPELQIGVKVEALELLPTIGWDAEFYSTWEVGEEAAQRQLENFTVSLINNYDENRNRPDMIGTSRLSPHLAFGEISPLQILNRIRALGLKMAGGVETYLKEIVWREFGYHLLFHFPKTPLSPLREAFLKFPWREDPRALRLWQSGMTGYPIVDAGMRELWKIGWMHNRVRMIVASFLVKDLMIPWQEGAKWFWDTLVDADLASNTLGWQWTSGCGADAAPYFRVFNPVLQGEKFDPEGNYVRRWVPELSNLPAKWIHKPFEAPSDILARSGVLLGKNYPTPCVEHGAARDLALEAYKQISSQRA